MEDAVIYVWRIIDALSKGISEYLRSPTRVAALYATDRAGPVIVYDPQELLVGQKHVLKRYLLDVDESWRTKQIEHRGGIILDRPGLKDRLCQAFHGSNVPFQLWIVELSEEDAHAEIVRNWLMKAIGAWELEKGDLLLDSTRLMLRTGARWAVEATIQNSYRNQTNSKVGLPLRLDWILDLLVGLTRAFEEKKQHTGRLAFQSKPQKVSIQLAEPVSLYDRKHIGKLLALTDPEMWLIADDNLAYGFVSQVPEGDLLATIIGGVCGLYVKSVGVGRIDRGFFHATDFAPDLFKIRDLLGGPDELHFAVREIIIRARNGAHGASIVVDLEVPLMDLGGNALTSRLSFLESFSILDRMAKVDGAIHLDSTGAVASFGCILDGFREPQREKLSRGSRFNSAVRFTSEHRNCFVIVVSEDGPVSFIKDGIDLLEKTAMPELDRIDINPPDFDSWFAEE